MERALEAIPAIKADCVRAFSLGILKKRGPIRVRTVALLCLSQLADPADLEVVERAVARGDYDPEWTDLRRECLFLSLVRQQDHAGQTEASKELVRMAAEDRRCEEQLDRDPFMRQLLGE